MSVVSERGDLCWEFKNLYVFGHLLSGEGMSFRVASELEQRLQSKDRMNDPSFYQNMLGTNEMSQETIVVSEQDLLSQSYWARPSPPPVPYYPTNATYVPRSW
jgi:hypothetical protein